MAEYKSPEIEIIYFSSEDIIKTSEPEPGENEVPGQIW